MRRLLLVPGIVALAATATASAALQPIRREVTESSLPRVRAGTIRVPAGHARGRVRVIVRLAQPPLAAWNADRSLLSAKAPARLDVGSRSSRTYLARLARVQAAAVAALHTAVPQALVQERYSLLLDGFAVDLPVRSLPRLMRLGFATKVYPSVSYFATLDRGPSVIGATAFSAATGDQGQGMKIGVIDTGVDWTNPFLNPAGFAYPPGFPKGDRKETTPKVIVARDFPAPGADPAARKAFDPTEPHGTHVAGIAAGIAGTAAPAGPDHPHVDNLSGVAPKAWIGSYRVFNIATPLGDEGDTPEIVKAFEAAVADGMNVINFSGGGPQIDPQNDALVEAIHNTVRAGVVPVIAAGNDRDDYGLGSVGSPGTAPDAISVAAVSNAHVFAPALSVTGGPPAVSAIPVQGAGGTKLPRSWSSSAQTLVDVTTLIGTDARPVESHLCGGADPNAGLGTLRKDSLKGKILLADRGLCSFASKAARAARAGAAGLILVDNRPGEANPIPIPLELPSAMIADLDGKTLRAYLATTGGSAPVLVSSGIQEIQTGRSGVVTSFSSGGPTDFGHQLKPDVSAPGLDVLSSTPPRTTGSTFSVFAGTSMATPHVAGAAALLLQRHPTWTPDQVKSALMTTAGPAWGDTARTQEASVLLEGAGLVNVQAADDPRVFALPQSLSFNPIDITRGAAETSQLVTLDDAGGGAGDWTVSLQPQAQTDGAVIGVPGLVTLTPAGETSVPVTIHVAANATAGQDRGFVVFTQGTIVRRVPYLFEVRRPALAGIAVTQLARVQTGTTAGAGSRVSMYCCPGSPFGPAPSYFGQPMNESGVEHVYVHDIQHPVANFGVAVLGGAPGAVVDPWILGSLDENDVQGYSATPVDVNDLTFDAKIDVGAAAVTFPRVKRFYVVVDSRSDPFTNRPRPGRYVLYSWENDVTPPVVQFVTTRVSAGRPLIAARVVDYGAGVDPLSLVISYGGALIGASAYDPATGLAVFGLPVSAPALRKGQPLVRLRASDFQEAKNVETFGYNIYPNTAFASTKIQVVDGPAVTWLEPFAKDCLLKPTDALAVAASSTRRVTRVEFTLDDRPIGVARHGTVGIYNLDWQTGNLKKGPHELRATVFDAAGRSVSASRSVRVCR